MSAKLKEFKKPNPDEGQSFPSFPSPPHDVDSHEGERTEACCIVAGNPIPKVVWRKGQWLQLDDGGRYNIKRNTETGECSMAIKVTRPTDVGKYKVVATNDFGEVTCHFAMKVQKYTGSHNDPVKNLKGHLKHREVKQRKKKTPEEKEKEILEILKKSDPKDYERICMEHGFYDFRLILRKLQAMKPETVPTKEFEALKVLKGLRHVTVNDEGTAVFEMHLENVSPDKHMMWFKNGELILVPGPEKRHELRRIGNVFQLIIRNANADDAGTYTLDIGGHKFDAVLTIKEQPLKFASELKSYSGKVKGRCVFECTLTRRSQKVNWFKNGEPIVMRATGRVQSVIEGKSHKLILSELELKDAGKYTAKVGDLESTAELKVQAAPIRFRQRLVNTEVKERTSATFECSVSSKDVKPIWLVNGAEIKNEGRYLIKSGDIHSLTIKRVALTDHNAEITVKFGETQSSAKLQVNAKPIKVVGKMQNAKCRKGQTAEFSCEIDDPDADAIVEWFKDDNPIELKPDKYEVVKTKGKYIIKIKNVQSSDEGNYQFQIRGVRSEAELYCYDPPAVDKAFIEKLKKNPLKFKAGTKAKIEVPFSGKPPQNVSWTNGRVTLDDRGRLHMENTDKVAILTVENCQVTDGGTYELKIINECGDMDIEIPIQILDKPPPPSGEIAVSEVGQDFAEFSWNPPIDDKVPVDNYIIEAKDKSGKWKQIAKVPTDSTSYKATGLKEGQEYQFRVKSANEEGQSEPLESKPITPLAPDDPPFVDPKVIEELEKNPIVVRAGETATIKVPCKGNPPPSVCWMHNEEEILPVKHHRANKSSSLNDVTLTIAKCQTSDSGVYEARIFNKVGGVVLKTKLIVKDVADFAKTQVTFDEVSPNEVSMSWKAPEEDGGSPVTEYVIERSVAGKDKWEKVGKVDGAKTNFKCKGCEPETAYQFRVKAVNEQGSSEPAVSAPVTCGAQLIPPSIDEAALKKATESPVRVKVGKTALLKFPIKGGQPPPTVSWEKDGKPLEEDGKRVVSSHNDPQNAQVIIHKTAMSDKGRYVCKIKNDAGEIEVPMELQVVDVPQAPQGPIEFSDVSAKGATLSWAPSSDDGGTPITHYIIEKKEENRKVWTAVGKTTGAETNFRANVPSGKTYRFRVRAVSEIGESASKESEPVLIKDPFEVPSAVQGEVEMETATNDSITISWPDVKTDGGSPVMGYYIEKRKKGTSSWARCNKNLCTERSYTADNLRTNMEYEFRVIAVNKAGESDPSRASKAFCACDPVEPPSEPSDLELIDSTKTSLSFAWKGAEKAGGADLIGYDIELRKDGTDTWIKYNDSHITGTNFTAHGLEHNAAYHVRIRSVNARSYSRYYHYQGTFIAQEFNIAPSFKMTSELEAVVRNGFTINAGGTIRIHVPYHARPKPTINWTKNGAELDNTVSIVDVDGVSQLLIRNARGFHTGTYKVVLKNASGSQSLSVKVVVIDVPSPPRGPLQVVVNENDITLRWQASPIDGGEEISGYIIQKREARGRDWQTVAQRVKQCTYTITGLQKQRSYYLRVSCENNIGKSEPLQTKDMVYIKEKVAKVKIEDVQYSEKDLRQPPLVTVPLKPRKVPEGVKVTLSCSVSGKPYPNTRWFKDGVDITDDPNYFKENVIGICRLVIPNVKASDSGVFKIIAENEVGNASSEANLIVEE
ncbi:myosin-binding protein C, slow-type-like [Clavelina lepadiformis]|uniref:myosin-binding protein C, slow-type-like n=1 Tax=Clavelina lepadiformis TaxID=159417 RepID=UPI004042D49B